MCMQFKKVDNENYQSIVELQIEDFQKDFIETPLECLEEAKEEDFWRPIGIYNKDTLVGFAMYGQCKIDHRVWLDRFLIDKRYQSKGYGKKAFGLLVERIFLEYHCTNIYLSLYEDNQTAIGLYKSFGFVFTGEEDTKGEKIMVLN